MKLKISYKQPHVFSEILNAIREPFVAHSLWWFVYDLNGDFTDIKFGKNNEDLVNKIDDDALLSFAELCRLGQSDIEGIFLGFATMSEAENFRTTNDKDSALICIGGFEAVNWTITSPLEQALSG